MIDTLLKQMPRLRKPEIWDKMGLVSGNYFIMTLHRPSNVDDKENLEKLLAEITSSAGSLLVVFPVHPRTAKMLEGTVNKYPNLRCVEPLGYLEFNYLVKNAKAVITDSGGITEEATVMGIPCMTLRNSTERPETCDVGTNELLGTDPANIAPAFLKLNNGNWKVGGIPELWDGRTSERIVSHIIDLFNPGYNGN